jgi:hypothetical protein
MDREWYNGDLHSSRFYICFKRLNRGISMTTLAQTMPTREFKFAALGTLLHGLLIALFAVNIWRIPVAKRTFDEFGLTLPWITQTYIHFFLWVSNNFALTTLAVLLLLCSDFFLTHFLGRYNRSAQLRWTIGIGFLLLVLECFSIASIELPMIKLREGISH